MLPPLPRRSVWAYRLLSHPAVSAFPERVVGSACASSFSRCYGASGRAEILGAGPESKEQCHGKSKRSQSVSRGVGTEQHDYRGNRNESELLADRGDRAWGRSPSVKEIER